MRKEPEYLTIKDFMERNKGNWPHSEATLRNIIARAHQLGFGDAIFKIGNRVLIDWHAFWSVVQTKKRNM